MKSRHGYCSNQNCQKRARLDQNENRSVSRLSNVSNTLARKTSQFLKIQSVNLIERETLNSKEMEAENRKKSKKSKQLEDGRTQDDHEKIIEEEVAETTFQRTRRGVRRGVRRGALDKLGSDGLEEDNTLDRAVMWNQDAAEAKNLLSLWDLVSQNREYTVHIQELEAAMQMFTSSLKASSY